MGALNAILGLAGPAMSGATGVGGANGTNALAKAGQTPAAGGDGNSFASALDGLQASQGNADDLAVKAATGDLNDVHNYTIAATEASLATEFTVAFRNRAVETFNDIMRMQI